MQEETLSGSKSLELIQSMINRARNQFSENGHLYLVWGWVVLICSVAEFVLIHYFDYAQHYFVWMLTWLAVIYQFFYFYKNRKKEKVKTYTGEIVSYVWLVFVILLLLTIFISSSQRGNSVGLISPLILGLYGMPTFLSGKILQFPPLVVGGIGCWILALISLYVPYEFQILFFGLSVIIAWIIPGYLLRKRYQNQHQ
jgi:membrane-associated HD superfamily phosphohydrolase